MPMDKPRKALSRTYASAIAGEMVSMGFEPSSGVFKMEFKPDVASTVPTEIYCECLFGCVYGLFQPV